VGGGGGGVGLGVRDGGDGGWEGVNVSTDGRVVVRKELRGKGLLKHVRWPEYQREELSEM